MVFYSYFYWDFSLSYNSLSKNIYFIIFGYHHLWYLAGIIIGGLLLFLLKDLNAKFSFSFSFSLFFMGTFFQYFGNFHTNLLEFDKLFNSYRFYRNTITVCFPFLTLGFLIHKLQLNEKIRNYLIPLFCLSLILLYVEVFVNYNGFVA